MSNALVPVQAACGLPELAEQINRTHDSIEQTFREAVAHAFRAGELLMKAKDSVPHGQWDKWLKANIKFKPADGRVYMQLAGLDAEKRQRVCRFAVTEGNQCRSKS